MSALTPPASAEPVAAEARSRDGTRIGYLRLGKGPGLVFSHGSLTTGEDWLQVASRLTDRFSCYVMSRRGRGRSAARPAHSLERECDNISGADRRAAWP